MSARENDPELKAAYQTAVDRLPALTRVVFLLHRVDDLHYEDIARRLSIDYVAVVACKGVCRKDREDGLKVNQHLESPAD